MTANKTKTFARCLWRACLIWLFTSLLSPAPSVCSAAPQGEPPAAGHEKYGIRQEGFFRIRYMREGEAAPPAADSDGNGCPDFVDDVAAQLAAAHLVFCGIGGFSSPLDSPRYAGVRHIDVEIRTTEGVNGHNGLAYDEISRRPDTRGIFAHTPGGTARVPVLLIALSRDIDPKKNPTPAHEYFHQIQNGMTHFKNPWFYEGMARWSERALRRPRRAPARPLPPPSPPGPVTGRLAKDPAYRETLFAASYGASAMLWEPLAALCPGTGPAIPADHPLRALKYSDGSPVLRGGDLAGIGIMKRVLEKLGEAENIPFARFSYGKWTEANQRRRENSPFIAEAVAGAAAELCPR